MWICSFFLQKQLVARDKTKAVFPEPANLPHNLGSSANKLEKRSSERPGPYPRIPGEVSAQAHFQRPSFALCLPGLLFS